MIPFPPSPPRSFAAAAYPADVTVSTAALSRVLRPSILTRLELSDGRFETFEMSAERLQVRGSSWGSSAGRCEGCRQKAAAEAVEAAAEAVEKAAEGAAEGAGEGG
jgi:hypothetical protein